MKKSFPTAVATVVLKLDKPSDLAGDGGGGEGGGDGDGRGSS